ncbi:short-chain dehydrogenase/reductase [Bdellovibrio sp. ZAP7]|uniref:SDR family NAD(P)-dependent oxidoreductase n=1 Tax=Bdellovibrio sp. ZAP7 TaxID=2231053 RepID=UPI0011592CF8|nr:SDR family NAD(P)-dependent oxidoreductase [Bdellovibrio sp. ZAP7]QDK45420.1 short-chain dehydrogenase/reductase [Bdellovibrio sp. ZAP7]
MKQVLITGASTGIGFDLTRTLCEKGYKVWAGVRKPESLDRLTQDFSDKLTVLKLDITNSHDIERALKIVQNEINPDQELILVNNAGIASGGPIEGLSLEEWRKVFDVNLFGMVEITKMFLPLIRHTKGRIINMGSISGRVASPFLGPYTASKFAVKAFSDSLRRETASLGVHVSLIEAGPIRTEIWSKSIDSSDEIAKKLSPEVRETYGSMMAALREGVVETAKEAVPVQHVTMAILHAIQSRLPRVNYLVGKNIKLQAGLMRFMSTRMMDKVIKKSLRFQKS